MTAVLTQVDLDLYTRVQQFYARQMQALDGGDFEYYAGTFAPDGIFQHSPGAEPAQGRAGIVETLVEFHKRFENDPVQRRHWFNHVVLDPLEDGRVRSTVYALVVTTRPGGQPLIAPSCVVHDVLHVEAAQIQMVERRVTFDQVP